MSVDLTQKPKAVLFDWDGTLANTRPLVVSALEKTLNHYGLPDWKTIKVEKRDTTKSLKENFPIFFEKQTKEAYELYLKNYTNDFDVLEAPNGAEEMLHYLSNINVLLCIVSNKEKILLEKEVAYLFPNISFHKILGNGDAEHNKPHPAPIAKALEGTGINPKEDAVWLVGDTKQDTECAYASDCLPILIGNGGFMDDVYMKEKQQATPALSIYPNFDHFLNWLKSNH